MIKGDEAYAGNYKARETPSIPQSFLLPELSINSWIPATSVSNRLGDSAMRGLAFRSLCEWENGTLQ